MIWAVSWALAARIDLDIHAVDTALDEGTRIRLEHTLWQAHHLYASRLGIEYPRSIRLDVTIYGDHAAFRARADERGKPEWSGGWFEPQRDGTNIAVFYAGGSQARLVDVFLHEGSHFLVSFGGRIPRWLNEGLAEGLETSRAEESTLIVDTPRQHAAVLKRDGGGTVEGIVLDAEKWDDLSSETAGLRYVRAWALTTVLMASTNGSDTLEAIAVAYRRTGRRSSSIDAIDGTYRGGVAGLQRDLDAFAASPPASTTVSTTLKGALREDALWTSCPDGRLVQTTTGCGL
ncbi:MAG: hypothetical protein R3F61_34080 [Myxococcota bacterium]